MDKKEFEKVLPKFVTRLVPGSGLAAILSCAALLTREESDIVRLLGTLFISIVIGFQLAMGIDFMRQREIKIRLMTTSDIYKEFEAIKEEQNKIFTRISPWLYLIVIFTIVHTGWYWSEGSLQVVMDAFIFVLLTIEFYRGFQAKGQYLFLESVIDYVKGNKEEK